MNYKDRLKHARENRGMKFPEDDYNVRLDTYDIGVNQKGKQQISLTWKIREKGSELHGKKIVDRFPLEIDFRFDTLLDLLDTFGLDLSQCQDPDDLDEVLEAAKDMPIKTKIGVSYNTKNGKKYLRIKYYALYEREDDEKEQETSTPAPKAKVAPKAVKQPEPEEEEDEVPAKPAKKAKTEEAPTLPKKKAPVKQAEPEEEEEEAEEIQKPSPKKKAVKAPEPEEEEEEEVAPPVRKKGEIPSKKPKKGIDDMEFDDDLDVEI